MGDNDTSPEITQQIQEENRKPGTWLPGQSGNPNGRPKKSHSITETIRDMMTEKPEIKRALGARILQMAADGDIQAIKTIWNYMDGMPTQKQEITADVFSVTRQNDTSQHVRTDEPTPETT